VLEGELGSGKTFLARAIVRELGVASTVRVTSPTFALVHEFEGRVPIIHADLYRLDPGAELDEIGLLDRRSREAVTLVEWGSRFPSVVRASVLSVALSVAIGKREARIEALGEHGVERVRALASRYRVW
jgi:tRNA threonylcarbamoyladenosine biosynthesis protein TsaE